MNRRSCIDLSLSSAAVLGLLLARVFVMDEKYFERGALLTFTLMKARFRPAYWISWFLLCKKLTTIAFERRMN